MSVSLSTLAFVRDLMRERAGNVLAEDKAYLVETRLSPMARRLGLATVDDLVARLRARPDEAWLREVVQAMTINETSFFRDGSPFEALRRHVLPELILRRAEERRLLIWSAACSTGQEAYSLAILLREQGLGARGWDVRVMASDVSLDVLDRARRGWFSELEASRGLPDEVRERWFRRSDGGWRAADELRSLLELFPLNLGGEWPPLPPFDLILIRNVLIYFDVPAKKQVLARARRLLRPGGYLMLGTSETTHNLDRAFEPVTLGDVTFYRERT
jgi:chemotaxis protein methyltransferase CheR